VSPTVSTVAADPPMRAACDGAAADPAVPVPTVPPRPTLHRHLLARRTARRAVDAPLVFDTRHVCAEPSSFFSCLIPLVFIPPIATMPVRLVVGCGYDAFLSDVAESRGERLTGAHPSSPGACVLR